MKENLFNYLLNNISESSENELIEKINNSSDSEINEMSNIIMMIQNQMSTDLKNLIFSKVK